MTLTEYTKKLISQLWSFNLSPSEIEYRENAFNSALQNCTARHIETRYYNLAHEIKCIAFLCKLGDVKIALDSVHTAGCDALLGEHYQIEFVCASPGTKYNESGYARFGFPNMKEYQVYDYEEKERFLFERIASVLEAKREFAEKHIQRGTLSKTVPYLIFLGLGELSPDMFGDDYGADLLGILMGKGAPTLKIRDGDTALVSGYHYRDTIVKYNGSSIGSDLFHQTEYAVVSGVLFSDAGLFDEYTYENTWLFLNPFANVKIKKQDFGNVICWSANSDGKYVPRRKGKQLKW